MPRNNAGRSRERSGRFRGTGAIETKLQSVVSSGRPSYRTDWTEHFIRHLRGFSPRATAFLREYFSDSIIEIGGNKVVLPLSFTGSAEKPRKTMTLTKTSVFETRPHTLVLSGVVAAVDRQALGVGSTNPVARVDAPRVDSHDGPGRFNVLLGNNPGGVRIDTLSHAFQPELDISEVTEINGRPVTEATHAYDDRDFWRDPLALDVAIDYHRLDHGQLAINNDGF